MGRLGCWVTCRLWDCDRASSRPGGSAGAVGLLGWASEDAAEPRESVDGGAVCSMRWAALGRVCGSREARLGRLGFAWG